MLQYPMITNQSSFLNLLTESNHGLNVDTFRSSHRTCSVRKGVLTPFLHNTFGRLLLYFTLTKQTSHALINTLKRTTSLIRDLLEEDYNYVLTATFQSDPLERHLNKYRQVGGGRFLVSLREVNNSEKILKISSVL